MIRMSDDFLLKNAGYDSLISYPINGSVTAVEKMA